MSGSSDRDAEPTRAARPRTEEPTRVDGPPSEQAAADAAAAPVADGDELGPPPARYERGEEIARGGMGRVVLAKDRLLGREVAVKEVILDDEGAQRRFARETRITARLEHPSIVPLYDAGRDANGTPYYVMRRVGGEPLDRMVKAKRTPRERLALLPSVLAAADAIAHAHRRGIIHRDLKPANILIGEHGETVVIDWGLAKALDDRDDDDHPDAAFMGDAGETLHTRVGVAMGTPGFMAPEQCRGDAATPRSDVYALGATLYHVLAARPPHAAGSGTEMMSLAVQGPPTPLDELAPGLPEELHAIIDKALSAHESERYPDASALADDLRRFLAGQLVAAHQYSARQRLLRFFNRHRAAVVALALSALVITCVVYWAISGILTERDRAARARDDALGDKRLAEQANVRERARGYELLVSQADAVVATDPARAIGLINRLPPDSPLWRRARNIADRARRRGLPWHFPASPKTHALLISSDGSFAFSAGSDGVIRRHTLAAHTTEVLAEMGRESKIALTAHDRTLAVLTRNVSALVLIDLTTKQRTVVDLPFPPLEVFGAGDTLMWSYGDDQLWVVRGPAVTPEYRGIRPRGTINLAPTGMHYVASSDNKNRLFDITGKELAVVGPTVFTTAWSADGTHLAAASFAYKPSDDEVVELTIGPRSVTRAMRGKVPAYALAYTDGDLWFMNDRPYAFSAGTRPVEHLGVSMMAVSAQRGAVFRTSTGFRVVGENVDVPIEVPIEGDLIAAAPGSRYAVVATASGILAYDLSLLLPKIDSLGPGPMYSIRPVGNHHVVIGSTQDSILRDLTTGTSQPLGTLDGLRFVSDPDATYVVRSLPSPPQLLRPGQPTIELPAERVIAVSASRIVLQNISTILDYDVSTGQTRPLFTTDKRIRAIARTAPWIAVTVEDGTVIRYDERTQHQDQTKLLTSATALTIAADGSVVASVDHASNHELHTIVRWRPGTDAPRELGSVEGDVYGLDAVGTSVFVTDFESAVWQLSPDNVPRRVWGRGATGMAAGLALDAGPALGVGIDPYDNVDVIDLETGDRWAVGTAKSFARPTGNAKLILTDTGEQGTTSPRVVFLELALPDTAVAFRTWLETLSNARVDDTLRTVTWGP